jgi:hypothetical protein
VEGNGSDYGIICDAVLLMISSKDACYMEKPGVETCTGPSCKSQI